MTSTHVLERRTVRSLVTVVVLTLLTAALTGIGSPAAAQTPPTDEPNLADTCHLVAGASFDDIGAPVNFTHGTAIDCFRAYGLTRGTAAGTYEPIRPVLRWQMALFLTRLATLADTQLDELTLPDPAPTGFDDIATLSQEAQDAISVLEQLGVAEGVDPTTYDPFADVDRDQMAAFINRLQGVIQAALGGDPDGFATTDDFFADDDGNTHEADINAIASVGITKGRRFGAGGPLVYSPDGFVTRAQMASFLVRHLGVNVNSGALASDFSKPDNAPTSERISQVFVDNVAQGIRAGEVLPVTGRAFDVVLSTLDDPPSDTFDITFFEFTDYSDTDQLDEYEGGEFTVGFALEGGNTTYAAFFCATEAGLIRTCVIDG